VEDYCLGGQESSSSTNLLQCQGFLIVVGRQTASMQPTRYACMDYLLLQLVQPVHEYLIADINLRREESSTAENPKMVLL
jgi:hypothetical protein